MLVDTGCDRTMVSQKLVDPAKVDQTKKAQVLCVHGHIEFYPTAKVKLSVGGQEQVKEVVVAPKLPTSVLLGRDVTGQDSLLLNNTFAVVTRTQTQKAAVEGPNVPMESLLGEMPVQGQVATEVSPTDTQCEDGGVALQKLRGKENHGQSLESGWTEKAHHATPGELQQWQLEDPTLAIVRENANVQQDSNSRVQFFLKDGLLYRSWSPKGSQPGDIRSCEQLMLPQQCRELVMRLSHDVPMAGHLGITKMKDRILQRYYWPGIFKDVANYCRGCEVCQRSTPRKPAKAGLVPIPIVTHPFQCIGMDLVGPLPRTQRGNRFILTICNYATRNPEAVALPSVEAPRIARELVHLCSQMGTPD